MDLPSCPACGQSVLDDDAEDCPFCGSSMSGSPVAAAPASSPAATKEVSAKPSRKTAKKRADKPAAAKDESPPNDDPFAVSAPTKTKAVSLRAKPEKGRRHRVICPMCDTSGFTARKAAGMEVRCANPECLVPLFTAPPIEDPNAESEQPEAEVDAPWWKSPANIAAVGAVVAVVGVGVWYFGFRQGPTKNVVSPSGIGGNGSGVEKPESVKSTDQKKPIKKPGVKDVVKQESLPRLREKAILIMETAVRGGELSDTMRPASFQLVADAYAQLGRKKQANVSIGRLANIAKNVPFYGIRPLAESAWQEMKRDPKNGAKNAQRHLRDAMDAASSFRRQTSRIRQDSVSVLAAVLYAAGQKDEAGKLIADHADTGEIGHTSLALLTARHSDDYDYDAALLQSPLVDRAASQPVAVCRILALRGRFDDALDWSRSQTNDVAKRECLLAWVEARAVGLLKTARPQIGKGDDRQAAHWAAVERVIAELDAAGRVSAYSRIGVHAKDAKAAAVWLKKAGDATKTLSAPKVMPTPGVKQVFSAVGLSTSRKREYRLAAVALADLARVENRWNAQTGWKSLSLALAYARSMAPSPTGVQARFQLLAAGEISGLREQITEQFGLDDSKQIEQKVREYRRKCTELWTEARSRFEFQNRVLEWTVDWSSKELATETWKEISSRLDAKKDVGFREPFLDTRRFAVRVPWMLATKSVEAGDQKTADEIRSKIRASGGVVNARQKCLDDSANRIAAGRFAEAAVPFNRLETDSAWRRQRGMSVACRIVKRHGVNAAYQFVGNIDSKVDPYLRVDAFELIASLATRSGRARDVWKLITKRAAIPEDKVAFCYGFIIAIEGAADEPKTTNPPKTTAALSSK